MDESSQKHDRRLAERIPQHCVIHSARRGSETIPQEKITGVLRDISGNGLSFLSDSDYAVGDVLELQIDLPGSQHQLLVKVVHAEVLGDSKSFGVYFINISSEHEKALMELLSTRQ